MDTPERIGLVQSIFGFSLWNRDEDSAYSAVTQYIRADLHEALKAERDALLKRLWPNREFGPQSFDEVATFIEQERQADKEYTGALAASNAELVKALETVKATVIELNMSNYTDDDVGALNDASLEIWDIADTALARLPKGQDNAGS